MFPYSDHSNDFNSGLYTSRPGLKKQVKDGSASLHASSKLYAQKVVNQDTTDEEVASILKQKDNLLDAMGVMQHHFAITGASAQFVTEDYQYHLSKAMNENNGLYHKELANRLLQETGIKASKLQTCIGASNSTVIECPISDKDNENHQEFIVVVQNQISQSSKQFIRVNLPNNKYEAFIWSRSKKQFEAVKSDILEQKHLLNRTSVFKDYEMFIPSEIAPNEITFVKIVATKEAKGGNVDKAAAPARTVSIEGFSEAGDILFKYSNKD